MQSPKERYEQDNSYRQFVDNIENLIHHAYFTPSEVREAAVMACIHYEMRYGFKHYCVPLKVNEAFKVLTDWRADEIAAKKKAKEKQSG